MSYWRSPMNEADRTSLYRSEEKGESFVTTKPPITPIIIKLDNYAIQIANKFAFVITYSYLCNAKCALMKRALTYIVLVLSLLLAADAQAYTLVIDAGHGGKDAGALGFISKEKDINLAIALEFGRLVEQNCPDVKVVYTRKTDTFVELDERARIANRNKADLFVSIHTNSTAAGKAGTTARGTETYTLGMHRAADNLAVAKRENSVITLEANYEEKYEGFDPKSSESYIIFELMQDEHMKQSVKFAGLVQQQFATHAGRVNKGVFQAGFLVLRNTSMPSALIELGYINNRQEEQFLNTKDGIAKMSRAIFNAFKSYKGN